MTIFFGRITTAVALCLLSIVCLQLPARAELQPQTATVRAVTVQVHCQTPLPAPLMDKINTSVLKVGQKALEGKSLSEAQSLQDALMQVMKKIFNEVLSGFIVTDIEIAVGDSTAISIYIEPEGATIQKVIFDLNLQEGVHPFWKDIISKRLGDVPSNIDTALAGIPVESARWATPIITEIISAEIAKEDRFPGFAHDITVTISPDTHISVTLRPDSPTIRSAHLKFRSVTLPSLMIEQFKFDLASKSDYLIGLPIIFAKEEEPAIRQQFLKFIEENSSARRLGASKYYVRLYLQKKATVSYTVNSTKYHGFARVKFSIGKEENNPDAEAHLGIFLGKRNELFTEINLFPGPLDLQFNIGIGEHFGNIYIAGGRNLIDGLDRFWATYTITEDISISIEKNVVEDDRHDTEGSISFKAHDFYSIDLVTDFEDTTWLRFNANL